MDNNDKIFEVAIGSDSVNGKISLKNFKNRVVASIGDIIIDKLSFYRWNNALKFLDKYNIKKQKRDIEGKETPLPPKFIIEILDNAIQESDEIVQEQWCNLLINWQDVERNCDQKYMYIEILKNLNINEIKLLKLISNDPNLDTISKSNNYYYESSKIMELLKLSYEEYELMMLNLFRLKVCDSLKSSGKSIMVGNLPVLADAGIEKIRLTIIGLKLIKSIND